MRRNLAGLRLQPAAHALGFDAKFGQLLPRFRELRFDRVGVFLQGGVAFLALADLRVQLLELARAPCSGRARSWSVRAPACENGPDSAIRSCATSSVFSSPYRFALAA